MSYRPPYGGQPPGTYPVPGPGGMTNMQPGQFTMGAPQAQQQQQGFQMMHHQQSPGQPQSQGQTQQMYAGQQVGGVYPAPGYGQMAMGMQQTQFMGQAGVVQQGMVGRGVGQQAGMLPGMAPTNIQVQQKMTPEQQKKYAEKQKKLLEEQKKKEEQERKNRYREEQKRKLKEFSTGGRSSMGSKSLDMGDLLSKSLMTSQGQQQGQLQGQLQGQPQQHPGMMQAPGMQYQHGMPMQPVGFMPPGHHPHPGMAPMQGAVTGARQPHHPPVGTTPHVTHSQSMDDGFRGFQKAALMTTTTEEKTEGDDFGDFLQAPSKSESTGQPVAQPVAMPHQPQPSAQPQPQAQPQPPEGDDDDSFGDFLGGPGVPQGDPDTQQQVEGTSSMTPDPKAEQPVEGTATKGSSLENMMMQSTDLSESQKQRKRFNQKPSLNQVKGHSTTPPKSVSTFTTSNKSRAWQQESADLSTLFTLPTAAQGGQQTAMPAVSQGGGVGQVGQPGSAGQVDAAGQPVSLPAFQQQQAPVQLPAWLQNKASLPTVYHQVLEASTSEGAIQTNLLYPIFLLSGLDRPFLGHIWSMVNLTLPGQLVAQELYMALALIAQAQRGQEISIDALCTLSEAPVPQLSPANQPPPQGQSQPTPLQQPGTIPQQDGTAQAIAPPDDDDDFAPFQEAPKTTSSTTTIPAVPTILPSISKFKENGSKAGKKKAVTTVSSLVLPSSSSTTTRNTASPSFMQDHTPTEGEDDESFDDFKSAPSDSGPADSELDSSPVPPLPGLNSLSAGSVGKAKSSAGASHIPVLVPPKGMPAGTFAAIPPPPHATKAAGSSTVRPFVSEEQLSTTADDFGDFGDFKAAGAPSSSALGQKKTDNWGSFDVHQFKHSASESNLQGMSKKEVDDRYAALRDIGSSLFDSEPALGPPVPEDDEFADFQQAGALPAPSALPGDNTSMPGNQGGLFDSLPKTDHLHQPSPGFAAFSPPKEGSDWAQAAKQDKDITASSSHEEEFDGFFSSRTNESGKDTTKKPVVQEPEDTYEKYSSLAGLHSFVSEEDTEVAETFGDFQTGSKPQTSSSSVSTTNSGSSKTSAAPLSSGITLFRLTPPPMTSSPPTSEDAPDDDRFSVLRDLSAVDPFEDVGATPDVDGLGADYYDTQFSTIDPAKVLPKPGLELSNLNSGDTSRNDSHKLELTLDTPSTTTNKTFPIGSINDLDLKNYDLNLTVDSAANSKGASDDERERVDSFGDFTSASTSEQAPPTKVPFKEIFDDDRERVDSFGGFTSADTSEHDPSVKINIKWGIYDEGDRVDSFGDFTSADTSEHAPQINLEWGTSIDDDRERVDSFGDFISSDSSKQALSTHGTCTLKSKWSIDDDQDRVDSFGAFTSADTSEQAPPTKDDSTSLVPSSSHPPPAPVQSETSLFGDRYSQVAGDSSDEGRHASEWEKCLTKCHEVMSKANSVFNNISSSSVCSEVIGSSAGVDYLTGVIEVYRVACRITTSIQGLGIDNDILGTLEKEINRIWNNLSAFLQLSSLKPKEGSFIFKTAMLRPEPSNTPQACGVCLLNVDSRSKAFDRSEDSHKLSYGGRQYHATCANLWVNMVDSILPALPLNTLL